MSISDRFKNSRIASRLIEEQIYEKVYLEMSNGIRRNGLWLKAIQKSGGNEERARTIYIKYCVKAIKDEIELLNQITQGDQVIIEEKMERDDSLNGYDSEGLTPLMNAVNNGDLCKVKELLAQGADPNKTDAVFGSTSSIDLANRQFYNCESKEKEKIFAEILNALKV